MAFKGWDSAEIHRDDGTLVKGIQPVIISASRSTDIPAFHSDWFFERLHKGYVAWTNPFNRVKQYVSFQKTRVFVFWTKNPRKFMVRLGELDDQGRHYYFQFTLNDYEREGLEPNVPILKERLNTFKELSSKIGKEKVFWRFDPLICTDKTGPHELITKVRRIAHELKHFTENLIISFADIENYKKVSRNLTAAGVNWRNFTEDEIALMGAELKKIGDEFELKITTCAEKENLSEYEIRHAKCIDGDLMIRLFAADKELMTFLGQSNSSRALFPSLDGQAPATLKDKGQRKECGCIVSKDIGQYNTCMHLCTYCYANDSKENVKKNFQRAMGTSCESILNL